MTARVATAFGYANGFTLWHFRSRDPASALVSRRYFDAGRDMLRAGDFIFVNLQDRMHHRGGILAVESVDDESGVGVAALAGPFSGPGEPAPSSS